LNWHSTLRNALVVVMTAVIISVYVKVSGPFLGTFAGYWLIVPLFLAGTAGLGLYGRWWNRLLWLNAAPVLAAIFNLRSVTARGTEPDAIAFLVFDVGYWMLAGSLLFLAAAATKRTMWPAGQ
jgi:hypothetical protein